MPCRDRDRMRAELLGKCLPADDHETLNRG
jgi:hypothetical protein